MAKTTSKVARKPVVTSDMRAKSDGSIVRLPTRTSNQPNLIDLSVIQAEASRAIADMFQSETLMFKATQCMAHAVLAMYDRLVVSNAEIGALSEMFKSREATKVLFDHIAVTLIGDKPESVKAQNDDTINAEKVYGKKRMLLNRAIELASVLAFRFVDMTSFNAQTGNWTVSRAHLFPTGIVPMKGSAGVPTVLNGRGYGGQDSDGNVVKVNASVAQFVKVAKPVKVAATDQTNAGQGKDAATAHVVDLSKAKVADVAKAADSDSLRLKLLAAYRNILASFKQPALKFSDLDKSEQETLTDVVKLYDTMKQRDNTATA